jgi:protein-glutamine gamma-glutamyltransferase
MIIIDGKPLDPASVTNEYPEGSLERAILSKMAAGDDKNTYDSLNQLKFELKMRKEIVSAANALNRSSMSFEVFRESKCNPDFWIRHDDGGFELKAGVKPADAIRDIYKNSAEYGTECATAIQIIYYKALLEIFPEDAFNKLFDDIYLMNWHRLSRELSGTGVMRPVNTDLPGDRRYFSNPDVDPETPEWQGENVIDMGDGVYYGHGLGKHSADAIIRALNENRREDAARQAYLMESAGRPDFKRLSDLYDKSVSQATVSAASDAAGQTA